ncbi:arginine--tRNA ligase, partial [Candidatus Micrarchaeota archaeon RBG_16_36_9]
MKEVIIDVLKKALKKEGVNIKEEQITSLLETPPSPDMGDYSFPCFFLRDKLKKDPKDIAIELRSNITKLPAGIEEIQTKGPYINFFVDNREMFENLVKQVKYEKDEYGESTKTKIKTMVEFPSPNTNKPLHLGHLRNMAIGESISRIFEFNGDKVIRANLNNDRGVHICKSMLAYKLFGRKRTPAKAKMKPDKFVGDFYVMFNQKAKKSKKLDLQIQEMLQKWESGDKETLELWGKMNQWALTGFKETYRRFGIKHDVEFFESEIYEKGKEMVLEGLKKGIFQKKNDGVVFIDLEKEKLGEKVLLRQDGTSIYITQDLYLAKLKYEQYKLNNSIYVVGNEQNFHFNLLFTIIKKLGLNYQGLKHLSHGMVNLPEGKMKSREGTVVDADDLIDAVQILVKKELLSRYKLPKKELEERSLKIALAAVKYFLLKVDIRKDMIFNPKASINFEGDTGPYILYSYARASSIMKKERQKKKSYSIGDMKFEEQEAALMKKLLEFKEVLSKSYTELNPSLMAN